MIKTTKEIKLKENEDVAPFINDFIKPYIYDADIQDAARSIPLTGLTEDGKRYALWIGRNTAIFAVRKDKEKVIIGLVKSTNLTQLSEELRKVGIEIQGFSKATEPYWNDLRACLNAAMNIEDTDEKERPEEPEEPEEKEDRESKERPEEPELPFEDTDFEAMTDNAAGYIKLGEKLEGKTKVQRSKEG